MHESQIGKPVTLLLAAAKQGDLQAARDLMPLVYDELRQLAASKMANERAGHSLNATALVHEAYLRMVDDREFECRAHFFAAAAEAMRRILVDRARQKKALKNGGDRERIDLDRIEIAVRDTKGDLLELDDALTKLALEDAQATRLVELRHFVGMSIPEAAEVLDISPRTADRLWAFARAWLHRQISGE
jgi:RNA polymerase sigma factor (TIGR02999 family)